MPTGCVRRTEQPRRQQVVVTSSRGDGEAVEGEWDDEVAAKTGGQLECFVGIAFGSVQLAVRDLHP